MEAACCIMFCIITAEVKTMEAELMPFTNVGAIDSWQSPSAVWLHSEAGF